MAIKMIEEGEDTKGSIIFMFQHFWFKEGLGLRSKSAKQ